MIDSNRLISSLPHFEYLKKIDINLKTERPLGKVDAIINDCSQSLQDIKLDLTEGDDGLIDMDKDDILKCIPKPNIHRVYAAFSSDWIGRKTILYMNQKFPKVKSLGITLYSSTSKSIEFINQFFKGCSWIKHYHVHCIFATPSEICHGIDRLVESEITKLLRRVKLNYSDMLLDRPEVHLEGKSEFDSLLTIFYSYRSEGHLDLFELYGENIKQLYIVYPKRFEKKQFVGEMLVHLFENCTRLWQLTLQGCDFYEEDDQSSIKNGNIDSLTIMNSEIHQRTFETIFSGLNRISILRISNFKFFNYLEEASTFICLDLTNTIIGALSVDLSSFKFAGKRASRYIFLNVCVELPYRPVDEEKNNKAIDLYYKYDFITMNDEKFKLINAKEYYDDNYNDYIHFNIGCKSIKHVNIIYNKYKIATPTYHKRDYSDSSLLDKYGIK